MQELDKKYVFHVPLYKFEDGELVELPIDGLLDELIRSLDQNSLYVTKVKSHYKSRCFDELLLTLFVEFGKNPEVIFIEWFRKNNHILKQESLAYECGNSMHIHKLEGNDEL